MVDIYRWHLAHPRIFNPRDLLGKYVAHDNRDAMAVSLKLTENVLEHICFLARAVLHDLHESVLS